MTWDGSERRKYPRQCYQDVLDQIQQMTKNQQSMHDENVKRMDKIIEFIEGNGHPGAKVRIDRLEMKSYMLSFVTAGVVMGLIGYSMKLVFNM